MIKLVNKYSSLSFEDRTIFNTRFSIVFNCVLAIGKIALSFFQGVFFLVAGIVNIFIMLSKLECFVGVKYPNRASFTHRNRMISLFLILAGLQYAIYMSRLIFTNVNLMDFRLDLSIMIACVSFVELGIAIKGIFNALGKGHYFRNFKIINLCSAFTAIALTEAALMSAASETDSRLTNGIFGVTVGLIIILLGIFILIAPKFSIIDRLHNIYKAKSVDNIITDDKVEIKLTNSKFYVNYIYVGYKKGSLIDGKITRTKTPIFKWNIFILITVFILSEILIFPYAIGGLITYFRHNKVLVELDEQMKKIGYMKLSESEE